VKEDEDGDDTETVSHTRSRQQQQQQLIARWWAATDALQNTDITDHPRHRGTRQRLWVNSRVPCHLTCWLGQPTFYGHRGQEW